VIQQEFDNRSSNEKEKIIIIERQGQEAESREQGDSRCESASEWWDMDMYKE
jgi:hypothetical protein